MPKIKRAVEVDVSVADIVSALREDADKAKQEGVFLNKSDGSRSPVKQGDLLKPQPLAHPAVAPDTPVLVVRLVPEAGVFFGAFYNTEGDLRMQFFNGMGFDAHEEQAREKAEAKAAKSTPKRAPKGYRR